MTIATLTRRALVVSLGFGLAACSPAKGNAEPSADARLAALGAEMDRTLDGAAYALEEVHDDADQNRRLGHADALLRRMSTIEAQAGLGLYAKAKAFLDAESYDVQEIHGIGASLAHDVERLHAAGGLR